MPLTLKNHQMANQFRQLQSNAEKGKQVYLNTLAVQAVQSFLSWLGIETSLQASDSWNPVMQMLSDTADLVVNGQGKLECRPVLPEQSICRIPPEVWLDRIGYVAVQFDRELNEALLLGFVPYVASPELPLSQLRSLDELLDRLRISPVLTQQSSHLSQWLQGTVESGWQTIEHLFGRQELTWNFRGGQLSQRVESSVKRGKILNPTTEPDDEPVVLLVELTPTSNPMILDIWVKVCPAAGNPYLPAELEVVVLDEADIAVMCAQARTTEMIQLRFSGMTGERFSIRVSWRGQCVTEGFVV